MKAKRQYCKSIEKRIDSVFDRRMSSVKMFSTVRRVPKHVHLAIEIKNSKRGRLLKLI